jgi:hypothetical protein
MLPCKTCKSNWQLNEKHPQTVTPPPPNAVVPVMKCSVLMPPDSNAAINVTSGLSRFQLRIFQRRWSRDQIHQARRWRNDSGGSFMSSLLCRCSSLRRLLAVLTDTLPLTFKSSRLRADVEKWFLRAHRAISLSFLGVVLRGLPDRGHQSTITASCKRSTRRYITEWCTLICTVTLLFLKPACAVPTACNFSTKVNVRLTIIYRWKYSIRNALQPQLAKTLCVEWHQ